MKKVEAAYDFLTPPPANIEDMTQPMGPLEEGDQRIVDAVHRLPEGEHVVEQDDGTRIRIIKDKSYGREQAIAQTTKPDGSIEQAGTLINKPVSIGEAPGVNDISADMSEWPADHRRGGRTTHNVMGNRVGNVMHLERDRPAAQAIKREVARKIDVAREGLGKAGVTAASKSAEQE